MPATPPCRMARRVKGHERSEECDFGHCAVGDRLFRMAVPGPGAAQTGAGAAGPGAIRERRDRPGRSGRPLGADRHDRTGTGAGGKRRQRADPSGRPVEVRTRNHRYAASARLHRADRRGYRRHPVQGLPPDGQAGQPQHHPVQPQRIAERLFRQVRLEQAEGYRRSAGRYRLDRRWRQPDPGFAGHVELGQRRGAGIRAGLQRRQGFHDLGDPAGAQSGAGAGYAADLRTDPPIRRAEDAGLLHSSRRPAGRLRRHPDRDRLRRSRRGAGPGPGRRGLAGHHR